jgi:ADP-ribose pyrophosphatase YjhB (NUDIX family)
MRFCPRCATPLEERPLDGTTRPVCPGCNFVYYHDPKVAVAVLVGQDGQILLVRRNHDPGRGLWSFPSGYVNAGELLEDAAFRETEEETGLRVQLKRLIGVLSESGNPVILALYDGEIVGGNLTPGAEAMEVGFFPIDALPELAFAHDAALIRTWVSGNILPLPAYSPIEAV